MSATLRCSGAASDLVTPAHGTRRAGAALDGQTIVAQQLWLERVETDRRSAELEVTRRDAEIESRRQALAAAQQRREVLERLKQRHRAEHQAADAQRAAATLDEMALAIHRRREAPDGAPPSPSTGSSRSRP